MDRSRPFLYNTCFTFLAPNDAVSDAISFKIADGKIGIAEILISKLDEGALIRAKAVQEANDWYETFTGDIFG